MSETDPKPFLSRWAKRKAASQSGQDEPEAAAQPEDSIDAVAEETEEEATLSDEELRARYELPDPEECTEEEQLDGFFDGHVPDRLRQMAMRRIWRLNPLFRFADEMVEYGEDFTDAATVIPNMQTAYKVGKGYLDKLLVEEEQAKAAEMAEQLPEELPEELSDERPEESPEERPEDSPEQDLSDEDSPVQEAAGTDQGESAPQTDSADTPSGADRTAEQAESRPQPDKPDVLPASGLAQPDSADTLLEPETTSPPTNLPPIRPKRMVFTKNSA